MFGVLSCVLPCPNPQTSSSNSKPSSGSISTSGGNSGGGKSSGGKGDFPYDYGNYEDFGTGTKVSVQMKSFLF